MNIVFMGTPTFALPALDALAVTHEIKAVYTRPDAVSHRGKTRLPSLVKARALELGIPVHTPASYYTSYDPCHPVFDTHGQRLVDADLLGQIHSYEPDVIVVAAYGIILPRAVIELPRVACINIHGSLLPRWRGAAPIQRAILAGDKDVGVCLMQMRAGMDTGPVCASACIPSGTKTYQDLIVELGTLGAQLVLQELPTIVAGTAQWIEQDEALVTYANKIEKGSLDLDAQHTTLENLNRVRASSHHERCRSVFYEKPVMILEARAATIEDSQTDSKGLYFACRDGVLEITDLKPDGKRAMTGRAFKAGVRP